MIYLNQIPLVLDRDLAIRIMEKIVKFTSSTNDKKSISIQTEIPYVTNISENKILRSKQRGNPNHMVININNGNQKSLVLTSI